MSDQPMNITVLAKSTTFSTSCKSSIPQNHPLHTVKSLFFWWDEGLFLLVLIMYYVSSCLKNSQPSASYPLSYQAYTELPVFIHTMTFSFGSTVVQKVLKEVQTHILLLTWKVFWPSEPSGQHRLALVYGFTSTDVLNWTHNLLDTWLVFLLSELLELYRLY